MVKDFYQVRKSKISKAKNRDTIFDVLLDPEQNKNKRAPDFNELVDEAMSLITGGTDSTAETLTAAIWYFNTELDCKRKLIAELDGCPRDDSGRLTLATVQQLPYLVFSLTPDSIPTLIETDCVHQRNLALPPWRSWKASPGCS